MGANSEREERESGGPSWMAPANERLGAVLHPPSQDEACVKGDSDPCADSKDAIKGSFAFLASQANTQLDRLQNDLAEVDKPNWQEALLEQCFDVALTVGGARVGEYLVEKAGHTFVEKAKTAAEFVKKSVEEAAPKGVKAAMEKLEGNDNPSIPDFIIAQKTGIGAMYQKAQSSFIHREAHQLATTREATAFEGMFDSSHVIAAAHQHYIASRDAYLTCLARQTLGTTASGTTAMDGSGATGHAANVSSAFLGIDKGILVAQVMVYDDVHREPGVWASYLNGVNDKTREQYEDAPLSSMRIPRQLVCSVRGDMQDFVVNIDETGVMSLASGDGAWLEARATAARPELARAPHAEQRRVGVELLLADLRIQKIGHGGYK